jgi:hypothetical protein
MNLQQVKEKLDLLRRLDWDFDYFGSKVHRYKLFPPLSAEGLVAIENKHGCAFPDDYRAFVTELGNGGAGPNYGLFPAGMHHLGRDLATWEKSGIGDLSKPFPHTDPWNLPEEFCAQQPDPDETTPEEEEDRMNEEWDKKLQAHYWIEGVTDGAIPVSDLGCARTQLLVINGPESGSIWVDGRVDYEGIAPLLSEAGERVTFAQWYLNWLDEGIRRFRDKPPAPPSPPSIISRLGRMFRSTDR